MPNFKDHKKYFFPALLFFSLYLFIIGFSSGQALAGNPSPLQHSQNTANDFIYPWPYSKTLVGTSHAAPLYDPSGLLAEHVLSHGALDARAMGFSVLKIWLGPEIFSSSFYRFENSTINPQKTFAQMLSDPEYQKTLQLPFEVFVLEFDTSELWATPNNRRLTAADIQNIEQQTYDLASTLLRTYAGTGKVFIIQNHEGDNHLADFGNPKFKLPDPNYVPPTSVAYDNYRDYFLARQSAIRRARKEASASNVALYHMCEVNAVIRSSHPELLKDRTQQAEAVGQKLVITSLTTEVLPSLDCDLYGYSAYDSGLNPDGKLLPESIEFIRAHTAPSLAFGRQNVVVSEIGIPEREPGFQKLLPNFIQNSRNWIQKLHLPLFLVWELYDNECATGDCQQEPGIYKNIQMNQARGFWMRDVTGHTSASFQGIQDLVEPQVNIEEVPAFTYQVLLGREASVEEIQSGVQFIQSHGREAYYLSVSSSLEARSKVISDVFQKVLHQKPSLEQSQFWSQVIKGLPLASAANLLILQGQGLNNIKATPIIPVEYDSSLKPEEKSRKKMIIAFYSKLLGRAPTQQETDSLMKSKNSCQQIAKSLSTGTEFISATQALSNQEFVQKLYKALLLRDGETNGVGGWKQSLDEHKMSRAQVAQGFAESDEMKMRCQITYEVP